MTRTELIVRVTLLCLFLGHAAAVAIAAIGDITTVAGSGSSGYSGDGGSATSAKFGGDSTKGKGPTGVATDSSGNIFIADTENHVIRKVNASTGFISTVAGTTSGKGKGGYNGDNVLATTSLLKKPARVAMDSNGNLYIADTENHRIRRVDAVTGIITTVAGSGAGKYFGDGGSAVGATVYQPHSAAYDSSGNVFIADTENSVIRKINLTTGVISTVAGTGTAGNSGNGGAATSAKLNKPKGIALDSSDNIYVADSENHVIRKINAATGIITAIAGTGSAGSSGDGGAATSAKLNKPEGVAVGPNGHVYIADTENYTIRKVNTTTGIITTIAGTGASGSSGDGGAATSAKLSKCRGLAVTSYTKVGLSTQGASSDNSTSVQTATKVNFQVAVTVNSITAFVGGRVDDVRYAIYADSAGEPGARLVQSAVAQSTASMDTLTINVTPTALAAGNYWLAIEASHNSNKYAYNAAGGQHRTVANDASTNGFLATWGVSATSGTRVISIYANISTVAQIYVADTENSRIRSFVDGGNMVLAAGTSSGFSGDGAAATSAKLNLPEGVAIDSAGNVYIADTENHLIRKVTAATGIISTIAGTGDQGYSGDNELATNSELNRPRGIGVDSSLNLLVADSDNHAVRRIVASTGFIETLGGSGTQGYTGDGQAASGASIKKPSGIKVDAAGNIYIADTENHVIRKIVAATGIITTVAGVGATSGSSGDGGLATSALLNKPAGVDVDSAGNIYIADTENSRVRKVTAATGIITTIAGTGVAGSTGDGGLPTSAKLNKPSDIQIDSIGDIYICDKENHKIRVIRASTGFISTFAGTGSSGSSGDGGAATSAKLDTPQGITISPPHDLYIMDTGNLKVRMVDMVPLTVKVVRWREVQPQ